ncbi:MAG: acyltransferase [Aquabacterium sp.]|uniref:acyltransferase family protein n=1 Tax=Aquabacterium sp. TaxID=1872578 RepID=UPI003BB053F9
MNFAGPTSCQGFDIPDLRGVLNLGAGVNFFFVLSGFVIAYRYSAMKRDEVPLYIVSRAARIYPVHVLTLLAYAAFAVAVFPFQYDIPFYKKVLVLMSNLSLTQAYFPMPEYYFSLNVVSWSLSCEIFFYATAALLFVRQPDVRRTGWVVVGLFLVSLACYVGVQLSPMRELGTEGPIQPHQDQLHPGWGMDSRRICFSG